jgi:hypothetical protein
MGGAAAGRSDPRHDPSSRSLVLELAAARAGRTRPRVCCIATASGDDRPHRKLPRRLRSPRRRDPPGPVRPGRRGHRGLPRRAGRGLRDRRQHGEPARGLAGARVDLAIRQAHEAGVVLAGRSAGAICWFESGTTDSFGRPSQRSMAGWGSSPEATRRTTTASSDRQPTYHRLIAEGILPTDTPPTTAWPWSSMGRRSSGPSASEDGAARTGSRWRVRPSPRRRSPHAGFHERRRRDPPRRAAGRRRSAHRGRGPGQAATRGGPPTRVHARWRDQRPGPGRPTRRYPVRRPSARSRLRPPRGRSTGSAAAGLVVLGSGAIPLARPADRRAFLGMAVAMRPQPWPTTASRRTSWPSPGPARPSSDSPTSRPTTPSRWLAESAGYRVDDPRRQCAWASTSMDRSTSSCSAARGRATSRPGTVHASARGWTPCAGRHGPARRGRDHGSDVAGGAGLAGSRGSARTRARGGARVANESPWATAAGQVLGMVLDNAGPGSLGQVLTRLGDAALVDTRVAAGTSPGSR